MLLESGLQKYFWAEAINTTFYVLNRTLLRPIIKKTPYELYYEKSPRISYFRVFGSRCCLLNTRDQLDKFDAKGDEGIFIGYSTRSKAYRVFNKRTFVIEESLHVSFDETNLGEPEPNHLDSDDEDTPFIDVSKMEDTRNVHDLPKEWVHHKDHP